MSKPILISTIHGNIIYKEKENTEKDKIVIKEKEPIDNKRRKNKHQIPKDNHIKNIIDKNDNLNENYKINGNFINNFNNYAINGINNFKDEIINVNNSLSLTKGIKIEKENNDIMKIDPLKMNFKTDLRILKRKNIIPIDNRNTSEEPNVNIKYENENNSSINNNLSKIRLINTDLREKKSRSVTKQINELNFNQKKQKTVIKLVKINKVNDNIDFVRSINGSEQSIKKEKNKITKINKMEIKTQKEENAGIKIYKNGENR